MDNIRNSFAASGLISVNPERVFGKLNIQPKTPAPPGSWSTNSDPKTPHNLKQLRKQASTIKKLLRHHTKGLSSLTTAAMGKGCEMAMNSGILFVKENQDLRAAHKKQAQKKKRSNRNITTQEGLFIKEGQNLLQSRNQVDEAISTIPVESAPEAE